MRNRTPLLHAPLLALILAVPLSAYAQTPAYETGFEGFELNTDFIKDFNISYGGTAPANTKAAVSGQWGITNNGNDFLDGTARPQDNPATNVKLTGLFLDPGAFASGAGTYEISFDLTGDPGGNPAFRAFVFAGTGYDLSGVSDDRLQLSLSAPGFGGYSGMTAAGAASASQLVEVDLSSKATQSGTSPVTIRFCWDGSSAIAFAIGGYNNAAVIDNFVVNKSVPYKTDFNGFVAGTDFVEDFNIAYGGIKPSNTKLVDSGQWGITKNGNDFSGGIARPQSNPATNLKMAGIFLDPDTFCAGAGEYRIQFDLTGDAGGNPAYQAYIFAGSGYDLSGTNDDRLQLSLSAGGFGGYTGLTGAGNAEASLLAMLDLGVEATGAATTPVTMTFTWDGSSAIAFSIGGYNNAATFDNFSVAPVTSVSGPVAVKNSILNGSGDLVIYFEGDPSTEYELKKSTDLSGFVSLGSPLTATTDSGGTGQVVIPAVELSDARQFFLLETN